MTYYFTLIYPYSSKEITVRDLLKELLIPRKWQHLLRIDKKIKINDIYRNFNELVQPGDKISLELDFIESNQQSYPTSGNLPDIIFEDKNILVINKKKGQKTHPNLDETNTALNDCTTYLGTSPYIVHRLDMLTGGLLLVAKNPAVVPILNRELTTKIFHREYLAVVDNANLLKKEGTINFSIGQDPDDQRKRMVCEDGLHSVTHYQLLKTNPDNTALIKLSLETGRTHQIRIHLAAIGCPIVGDPLYNPNFKEKQDLHLLAYQMEFIEPFSFKKIQLKLPGINL